MAEVKRRPPTIDELRHRIDFPDPAASPLGTDDEAAGTSWMEGQRATAGEHERRGDVPPKRTMGALWAMLLVIVLVLLAAWWGLAAR